MESLRVDELVIQGLSVVDLGRDVVAHVRALAQRAIHRDEPGLTVPRAEK